MALCRTDLKRLNDDPDYDRALQKAYNRADARRAAVRLRYDRQRAKALAAYEASLAKIDAKEEAALEPVGRRRERDCAIVRASAIKRLGLRQLDLMDEEGLAQ